MAGTEKRNAYATLGIHKGAAEEDIKQAYVNLVKRYDPEVHTERFMIIQAAFNKLKDPEKRAKEDILAFNPYFGEYTFNDDEQADIPDDKLEQAITVLLEKKQNEPALIPQIVPKLIQIYFIRSHKLLHKKLLKEAMEDWTRILELDPTNQRAKNNLFCGYCRLGYSFSNHTLYTEAIEQWELAIQMNADNHKIIHNLALAYEYNEDFDRAIRYWSETMRRWKMIYDRDPSDEYLKTCIIEAHRHHGEIGKPSQQAQAMAQAQAAAAQAAPQQAPAPRPAGAPQQQAAPQGQQAPRPASAPAPRPAAGQPAPAAPSGRDDLQAQAEILKLNPEDFDANFKLAHLLIEAKRWPEAISHLMELTKKFPRNIEVLNALGIAQLSGGNSDHAFQTWNRALKLDPKNFQIREALIRARMTMGRALRDKNLYINSLVHFKELAKLMPDSDEVHFELGKTYHMQGDSRSAFNEYQTVLKINPKHKVARTSLSELKMKRA